MYRLFRRVSDRCGPRHERHAHRGFDRQGWEHGGRGGRGRFFDQGDLRPLMLQLIAERPRHGYEVIKAIEEMLAGAYAPSPGTVYPALTYLEEMGLIVQAEAGQQGRKAYAITESGRAHLREQAEALSTIAERMQRVRAMQGERPPAPLLRAYENLKTALRLRVARGGLTDAQIAELAALLDQAAQTVERS